MVSNLLWATKRPSSTKERIKKEFLDVFQEYKEQEQYIR